jgi:hypothetical protein
MKKAVNFDATKEDAELIRRIGSPSGIYGRVQCG